MNPPKAGIGGRSTMAGAPRTADADLRLRTKTAEAVNRNRMPPPPVPVPVPQNRPPCRRDSTDAKPQRLHLGLFEIGRPLGKGKFGRVYLVKHRQSGFLCALKVLEKAQIARENAEVHVRREIEVHGVLRHPGVLGFYNWFHDSRRIYLLLEYAAGGELVCPSR